MAQGEVEVGDLVGAAHAVVVGEEHGQRRSGRRSGLALARRRVQKLVGEVVL